MVDKVVLRDKGDGGDDGGDGKSMDDGGFGDDGFDDERHY